MLKYAFVVLCGVHGLVHVVGFAKAFEIGRPGPVTQFISKPLGVLWLGAGASLLTAAALRGFEIRAWSVVALIAVAASQALVFAHWDDTKWGTVANCLLVALAIPALGAWQFDSDTRREVEGLESRATAPSTRDVEAARNAALPPNVTRWLGRSRASDAPLPRVVRLRQRGRMQTSPEGRWMPFTAQQWFSIQPPGFVWVADVRAVRAVHLAARDEYIHGRGRMQVRLASLLPVVDAEGPKIDQGSLLRYLAEIIWFPSAAAQSYLRWEDLGSNKSRATMTHRGVSAAGVFSFNDDGDVVRFEAQRYRDETLEDWLVEVDPTSTKTFGATRVPTQARVTWGTPDGDWKWLELTVETVEYSPDSHKRTGPFL